MLAVERLESSVKGNPLEVVFEESYLTLDYLPLSVKPRVREVRFQDQLQQQTQALFEMIDALKGIGRTGKRCLGVHLCTQSREAGGDIPLLFFEESVLEKVGDPLVCLMHGGHRPIERSTRHAQSGVAGL